MSGNARLHFVAAFVAPLAVGAAEPQPIQSTVESVGLFKNGLLVVRETMVVPGPGTYHLDTRPNAIHGTLWFESEAKFEARTATRREERPAPPASNLVEVTRRLEGAQAVLTLTGGETLQGIIMPLPGGPSPAAMPSTIYPHLSSVTFPTAVGMVPIQVDGRISYVPMDNIKYITQESGNSGKRQTETSEIPTLELVVDDGASPNYTITMTYLTRGMAWAPSYHIEYDDSGTATIGVSTIIRNEWRNLDGTRVELISGFPQIEHSSVTSLLSNETTLESFFSQISAGNSPRGGAIHTQMIVSNTAMPIRAGVVELDSQMAGAGEDLHFQDIGPVTIASGSAISRQLATTSTAAKRFVDWRIADGRDQFGRLNNGETSTPEAWDSIRFTNPFDFPLTTAPVSVWIDGRFRGQSTTSFINPGAPAVVKTTKAMSVETTHEEFDISRGDPRRILNNDYQPITVRAEMKVTNRRSTPVTIEITREFQGTMITASDEPAQMRSISKRNAVNPTNEANWTIDIAPGQQRLISLDYEVLVRI
jgi:hypothetical protein